MKKLAFVFIGLLYTLLGSAQINTDRVILIGRNALYYEDYVLSIQYFNQAIRSKPYLPEPYFYRAIAKYYLDDTKGAEDDCTLAIERNPFMVKAYQLRGDARQAQDNNDGAMEDYEKALEVYPNDKFVLINLGIVNIRKKNFEVSEQILTNLVNRYPSYVQVYLVRGAMYQEKGDTVKAFEDYDAAIKLDKYLSQSYSMRGLLRYHTKEYEKSIADFNEAIRLEPHFTGNYINRGLVRYAQNDLRGSMTDYDKVVELDKYNTIARFNRALLRGQVGDNNRAIEDFDMVLGQDPNNYIAIINRGLLRNTIGDYDGALTDLNTVLDKYPDFHQGYYARADVKRKQNDLKGADQDIKKGQAVARIEGQENTSGKDEDKIREKSDSDLDKFNFLVVADKQDEEKNKYSNKHRGRVQNKQVTIDLMPRFVTTYYEKDDEVNQMVHFSQLVDRINKMQLLPHQLRLTNTSVALNELQVQEHFKSIDELSKHIEQSPRSAELYYARAIDYMLVQDFGESIADLNKAIEIEPQFALAYFSLAVAYTKQLELKENENVELANTLGDFESLLGKKKAAVQLASAPSFPDAKGTDYEQITRNYAKVMDIAPDFVYTYYNRAEIRYTRNDYRSAILDYNETLRLNPDFGEAYYNRGLCRFYINDKDKALEDMRKAGELGIVEAYSIIKRMTE